MSKAEQLLEDLAYLKRGLTVTGEPQDCPFLPRKDSLLRVGSCLWLGFGPS